MHSNRTFQCLANAVLILRHSLVLSLRFVLQSVETAGKSLKCFEGSSNFGPHSKLISFKRACGYGPALRQI